MVLTQLSQDTPPQRTSKGGIGNQMHYFSRSCWEPEKLLDYFILYKLAFVLILSIPICLKRLKKAGS
jgi:hypothetical protein